MEAWQREHICKNLVTLISNIICNETLLAFLTSNGCLSKSDRPKMIMYGPDEEAKSRQLLEILETRIFGYQCMTKGLYLCGQTGAVITLLSGVEIYNDNIDAFEYCEIKLDIQNILNSQINFGGAALPFIEICKDVPSIENLVSTTMTVSTFKELVSGLPLTIMKNTTPDMLPYYIPRSILVRSILDESIFESVNDVCVLENIEWHQLTLLARKYTKSEKTSIQQQLTDRSSNQINNVTVRSILLEDPDHFYKVSKQTTNTVYWIKQISNEFHHVTTKGNEGIKLIQHYISKSEEQTMSQSAFVASQLPNTENNAVIMYDSPEMGKSVLLADLARNVNVIDPKAPLIWMHCSEIVHKLAPMQNTFAIQNIREVLAECSTVNRLGHKLLNQILSMATNRVFLFLDSFDELNSEDQRICKNILECIVSSDTNIKVVIASRPYGGEDLEVLLGVLGYNILSFQEPEQVSFFLDYWQHQYFIQKISELGEFAKHTIKTFLSALTSQESEITGIPLQCRMLADLYADDAKSCAKMTGRGFAWNPPECRINSLFKMYQEYFKLKFNRLGSEHVQFHLCI